MWRKQHDSNIILMIGLLCLLASNVASFQTVPFFFIGSHSQSTKTTTTTTTTTIKPYTSMVMDPSRNVISNRAANKHNVILFSAKLQKELELSERFERWRFLQKLFEGEINGDLVNRVLYLVLRAYLRDSEFRVGLTYAETGSLELTDELREKIDQVLLFEKNDRIEAFEPDSDCLPGNEQVLTKLKELLPDAEANDDMFKSLWDTTIDLHGREIVKINEANPTEEWNARCLVGRILICYDFLMHGVIGEYWQTPLKSEKKGF